MKEDSKISNSAFATLRIYGKFMAKYPVMLATILLLLPIASISANILLPLVYAEAINTVSTLIGSQEDFKANFGTLFWQSIVLITIAWVTWRIIGFVLSTFEYRVKRDLEQHIFRHLTTHSYDFHVNSFSGSLVAQTSRMTNAFERLFDSIYFDLLNLIIKITAVMVVLIPRSLPAALLIMAWVIVFTSIMLFMQIKKMPYSRATAAADSKVTAALADSLTNIFTIITFGKKKTEQKRFNKASQKRYKIALKDWYISEYIFAFQGFMMFAVEAIMIWLTISMALKGSIGIGDIVLVQIYLLNITGSMWNFGRVIRNIERSLSDAHEMTVILGKTETVKDSKNPEKVTMKKGEIAFSNVDFSYDDTQPLFTNFSLKIAPGKKIGLVGPSGGGKSTITKLVLRMMDIQSGEITIDKQNIANVAQDELRTRIAYVPQEPILFHRTLKENISYGNGEISDAKIVKAAKAAHAHEFIEKLPKGYDTLVGERGVKLSGGQRQRIAIARAMLKDSPILLLDEATSALDSDNERMIQEALWELMKGKTTIVIAHRLSTIQHMDEIVVIDNGTIVEQGSHSSLINGNGMYSKLWEHQSGGFILDK
jgi:ATP-binding cassette, subfamily B, bacterial